MHWRWLEISFVSGAPFSDPVQRTTAASAATWSSENRRRGNLTAAHGSQTQNPAYPAQTRYNCGQEILLNETHSGAGVRHYRYHHRRFFLSHPSPNQRG